MRCMPAEVGTEEPERGCHAYATRDVTFSFGRAIWKHQGVDTPRSPTSRTMAAPHLGRSEPMPTWKIAGVQIDVRLGDKAHNLGVIRAGLRQAASHGARLVI